MHRGSKNCGFMYLCLYRRTLVEYDESDNGKAVTAYANYRVEGRTGDLIYQKSER